jgi:isoamylase
MDAPIDLLRGEPWPLGATVRTSGVNFAVYAPEAERVELVFFEDVEDSVPSRVVHLHTRHHRAGAIWHVFVQGLGAGQLYGWRVHGPKDPSRFRWFDGEKLLLDPYAREVRVPAAWSRADASRPGPNTASALRSVVVDAHRDVSPAPPRPRIRPTQRVIYEIHVRGFTMHPTSGVKEPGTFRGLIERIPYLRDLGVTTIELLPIFQFVHDAPQFVNPLTGDRVVDYWGYNPISFFAAHHAYIGETSPGEEAPFRAFVHACHKAGIEVVLDVVYNHTGEGGAEGPLLSFRGFDNPAYYIEDASTAGGFANYSGCGNTLSCNHPVVRRMILESLRYWAESMGVDGFRFDLASIFTRGVDGRVLDTPPLTWEIESDPALQQRLLIAEAWDAAGLFQVGSFPGERWAEWNGTFRDDARAFWRGDEGMAGALATRMMGSPDLYEARGRSPAQGINYIACHDGFTLRDLVSHTSKHNEANGEGNRDGANDNRSWNHGYEGVDGAPPAVEAARARDTRNLLATLFLAQGTPMLLGGDELGRTQRGNNNAWCHDSEMTWVDWSLLEANADLHAFTRALIHYRHTHPSLHRARFLFGEEAEAGVDPAGYPRVAWHGVQARRPDWSPNCKLVLYTLSSAMDDCAHCILLYAGAQPLSIELPPVPGGTPESRWRCVLDTSRPAGSEFSLPEARAPVEADHVLVSPRTVMAWVAHETRPLSLGLTATMHAMSADALRGWEHE